MAAQAMGLPVAERIDDLQLSGLRILQDTDRFCFGMDAVLLSGFVRCRRGGKLLDIGTGTGILPLLLSVKTDAAHLTGIEIQDESADMARRSVRLNGLEERIDIITGDIREAGVFAPASFDVICSNPPYGKVSHGLLPREEHQAIARYELCCTLDDVVAAAARYLVVGGSFYLVHKPGRIAEMIRCCEARGLAPKRLRMVYPYVDREPTMLLMEAVRGGGEGTRVEPPLIIYEARGRYSEELRRDYGY